MQTSVNSWRQVQEELLRRITSRDWPPGELLPTETELAKEFGCARATVNRAMRELAGAGLLDRRRKGGTRVVINPVRKATLDIPVIRAEVEQTGARWHHEVLERKIGKPPVSVATQLALDPEAHAMRLRCVHFANRKPFLYEKRWINLAIVPAIKAVDLTQVSANEWLVQQAPFTHGQVAFSAKNATTSEARALDIAVKSAVFVIDRSTFSGEQIITSVTLTYAPGYTVHSTI